MPAPVYLAELPQLSELIWEIEKHVIYDPKKRYGNWSGHPIFPDEDFDPWTQAQWDRYDNFIKAGSDNGFLPIPKQTNADPPSAVDHESPPFSPLAMSAALDICGYKRPPTQPQDFVVLAQALADSAKSDLDAFFASPGGTLEHVERHALGSRGKVGTLKEAGVTAAHAVKQAIQTHLMAMMTWFNVLDQLKLVDWNDQRVIMNLASDPNFAQHENTIPLCLIMLQVEGHEATSAMFLRYLFQQWWDKGDSSPITSPSHFHKCLKANLKRPERELQARSLDRTSKFERAVVRVCRPSLHAAVPFHISLLDMEQLLLEKPTRSHQLSEALMKGIGYQAMVVQLHHLLRTYICERAAACPGWDTYSLDKQWGKGEADSRTNKPDTPEKIVEHLQWANARAQRSFRDERMLWFMSSGTGAINWAHYISFDSTLRIPTLFGLKLRTLLDAITSITFDCSFIDMMEKDEETSWSDSAFDALLDQDDWDMEEDLWAVLDVAEREGGFRLSDLDCIFKPEKPTAAARRPAASAASLADRLSSISLAQSGHAYRRDNPARQSTDRKVSNASSSVTLVGEGEAEKPILFKVNNKQLKLAERIFGKRAGKISWTGLVNLFKRLGFWIKGMGGSAHHLTPVNATGKSIILYRPHPVSEFTSEQAAALGHRLAITFGWTIDNFGRQAEGAEQDVHLD